MSRQIFVAFAPQDRSDRDWLVQHYANEQSSYEFVDVSAEGQWGAEWKARCGEHIRACSHMIALVSKNTHAARCARWQMEYAAERGKPTLGVHVCSWAKGKIPSELAGCKVVDWTWSVIEEFLDGGMAPSQGTVKDYVTWSANAHRCN